MKDIIFFGIQGSGKGTQARLLLEDMPEIFSYLSTGDVFRAILSEDNAIGNYLKDRITRGKLVDDRVTDMIFRSYFYTVKDEQKYMLLDGYPRSVAQINSMFDFLKKEKRKLLGIQFVLSDEVALERMRMRGRSDDTENSMKFRISQFYEKTQPTIDYFSDHSELVQIDASKSIEEIYEKVKSIVTRH